MVASPILELTQSDLIRTKATAITQEIPGAWELCVQDWNQGQNIRVKHVPRAFITKGFRNPVPGTGSRYTYIIHI